MPPATPDLPAPALRRSASVDVDVAIVGAGAAGLAAALTAQALGLRFALIEARQRSGGRAWTATTPLGRPFDVGASWIHAADQGNPFAEIALALRAAPRVDRRRRVILDARGQRRDAATITAFLASRAAAEARIVAAAPGACLADCLPSPAASAADGWAWTNRAFAGPWLCGSDCAVTDAADWAAARQGEDWLLPGGYGNLVQQLADGVPVTTGCVLEALEVGRGRVALATSGGRIEARHVVLTVPLGVLQAERISFSPPLPASVQQALDTLPMGCLMKVGIDLIADPFGETDTYFLHYPASDEAAVLYLMQPGGQAMAYAFVGGSAARALEPLDDAAVREEALAPLRHLLGAATVDRSFGPAVATRWAADPFAFGSYAIARPGGFMARRELAQPLFERIYLAGEATAPDGWMGTVGGAWLAGRAAMAAIDRARGLP